jgi:Ca2+-binding EF-hand superfamily protein
MDRRHKYGLAGIVVATLLASGTVGIRSRTVLARSGDAPPRDKIALGEGEVKQLVLLMDQDKNGKVSEQEFMKFMKAEFKRLDKDRSGELDVKELSQSQIRSSTFMDAGK